MGGRDEKILKTKPKKVQRKAEEVAFVESCSDAVDSSPNLTSVPQGAETLPYLNREAKS